MSEHGYQPVLLFDTDDPEFCRGFEGGMIWRQLCDYPSSEVAETVSARNAEMLLRMAEACGRPVQSEELGEGWLRITFGPSETT